MSMFLFLVEVVARSIGDEGDAWYDEWLWKSYICISPSIPVKNYATTEPQTSSAETAVLVPIFEPDAHILSEK